MVTLQLGPSERGGLEVGVSSRSDAPTAAFGWVNEGAVDVSNGSSGVLSATNPCTRPEEGVGWCTWTPTMAVGLKTSLTATCLVGRMASQAMMATETSGTRRRTPAVASRPSVSAKPRTLVLAPADRAP